MIMYLSECTGFSMQFSTKNAIRLCKFFSCNSVRSFKQRTLDQFYGFRRIFFPCISPMNREIDGNPRKNRRSSFKFRGL